MSITAIFLIGMFLSSLCLAFVYITWREMRKFLLCSDGPGRNAYVLDKTTEKEVLQCIWLG